MPEKLGALNRLVARLHALLNGNWYTRGSRPVRNTIKVVANSAEQNELRPHDLAERATVSSVAKSEDSGQSHRFVAYIHALLKGDWHGISGRRVHNTMGAISEFTAANHLRPRDVAEEIVVLGRRKLEGLAKKEYSDVVKNFAEAEGKKIDTELKRRTMESEVRKKEAEARKAEIDNLNAEFELVMKLKTAGVTVQRDKNGQLSILPAPRGFDYPGLADHLLERSQEKDNE